MSLGVGGEVVARVRAVVDVDTHGLTSGLKEAEQQTSRTGRALHTGLRVAAIGAAGAVGIATAAVGASIKAAVEAQVQQAKLKKAVENAGISWHKQGGQIEDSLTKMAEASGFMKGDLSDAFGKLATVTHSASMSHKLLQQAMDISRATGKPLTATTLLVSKAYDGSSTALSRMGIVLPKITTAQDALKASGVKATAQQIAAAKAADHRSQREANLHAIQKKFGGQSAAYAKTAAGEWARFHSTLNIVEEGIGQKLLPVLSAVLGWILKVAQSKQFQSWLGDISTAIGVAKDYIVKAWDYVKGVWDANSADIIGTAKNIVKFIVAAFKWLEPILKTTFGVIVQVVKDAIKIVGDIIHLAMDAIQGHWGKAWGDMKSLVKDELTGVWDMLKGYVSIIGSVAGKIGGALWDGIVGALKGLGNALTGLIKGAVNAGIIGPLDTALNVIHDHWPDVYGVPGPPFGHNPIPKLARGGYVPGGYNGGRDSVMAMLSPGEMVLNRPQQSIVSGLLGGDVGKLLGFAGGGVVPGGNRGGEVHVHQTIYTQTDDQGVHMRRARFAAAAAFGI